MFVFEVIATPSSSSEELGVQLPKMYTEFSDLFDNSNGHGVVVYFVHNVKKE